MKERSEEDIISKAPIVVTLGASTYSLKPLPILKAREWRTLLNSVMADITGTMSAPQDGANLGAAMTAALIAFPDKVAELVFAWAPELDQGTIISEATEEQMAYAYSAVLAMAYPFLAPLVLSMRATAKSLPR